MKGKYLITTDNWFTAPDCKNYKAVWGEAYTITTAEVLGLEPNRNSANWMVKVGTEEHHIIIAGGQIHYAVSCPERPNTLDVSQRKYESNEMIERDSLIYIPEEYPNLTKDKPLKNTHFLSIDWSTDKKSLLKYLRIKPEFFESGMHMELALDDIIRKFRRFRCFTEGYGSKNIIEIEFLDGDRIELYSRL